MRTQEIKLFTYEELGEQAREKAREQLVDGIAEENIFIFYEDTKADLAELFPHSNLNLEFDFSCTQGSGLNIYGNLFLCDFLEIWNAAQDEKSTISAYLNHIKSEISFSRNRRYTYSMKFIDKKEIDFTIEEAIEDLKFAGIDAEKTLLFNFFNSIFSWFEDHERELYENGYILACEIEEEIIAEYCENYNIEFLEDGAIF